MSIQPIGYAGLPKRFTAGTQEPAPGQPAYDINFIDDFITAQMVPLVNALVTSLKEIGAMRWEKVDARASAGRAAALRGRADFVTKYGPPLVVEWVIDVGQAIPTNFWEAGRVEGGVTYPGDYAIEVAAA